MTQSNSLIAKYNNDRVRSPEWDNSASTNVNADWTSLRSQGHNAYQKRRNDKIQKGKVKPYRAKQVNEPKSANTYSYDSLPHDQSKSWNPAGDQDDTKKESDVKTFLDDGRFSRFQTPAVRKAGMKIGNFWGNAEASRLDAQGKVAEAWQLICDLEAKENARNGMVALSSTESMDSTTDFATSSSATTEHTPPSTDNEEDSKPSSNSKPKNNQGNPTPLGSKVKPYDITLDGTTLKDVIHVQFTADMSKSTQLAADISEEAGIAGKLFHARKNAKGKHGGIHIFDLLNKAEIRDTIYGFYYKHHQPILVEPLDWSVGGNENHRILKASMPHKKITPMIYDPVPHLLYVSRCLSYGVDTMEKVEGWQRNLANPDPNFKGPYGCNFKNWKTTSLGWKIYMEENVFVIDLNHLERPDMHSQLWPTCLPDVIKETVKRVFVCKPMQKYYSFRLVKKVIDAFPNLEVFGIDTREKAGKAEACGDEVAFVECDVPVKMHEVLRKMGFKGKEVKLVGNDLTSLEIFCSTSGWMEWLAHEWTCAMIEW